YSGGERRIASVGGSATAMGLTVWTGRGQPPRDERRADDAGVVAELRLRDAHRVGRGDHRPAAQLLLDAPHERLAERLDEAAAEHDELGVDRVGDAGDADRQVLRGAVQRADGLLVALGVRLGQVTALRVLDVATLGEPLERRPVPFLHAPRDFTHHAGAAGERLQVALRAAAAAGPAGLHGDVAELAGRARRAAPELAVEHDAAPDAGAGPDRDPVAGAAPGAGRLFGQDGDADVVVEPDRHAEPARQLVGQRHVLPAVEVGRGPQDPARRGPTSTFAWWVASRTAAAIRSITGRGRPSLPVDFLARATISPFGATIAARIFVPPRSTAPTYPLPASGLDGTSSATFASIILPASYQEPVTSERGEGARSNGRQPAPRWPSCL